MSEERFHGWVRPGPPPEGGVAPEDGETLDAISGKFRIFQYAGGHRFSTDDVLTAWYGTTCAPRVERCLDLGSGIGSVALVAAWRLPGARLVTIEAQPQSVRLARKSFRYNGIAQRVRVIEGDFRDSELLAGEPPFDLILGSPPYFPEGTASEARHPQAVPARIEMRGSVSDYAAAAARSLAPGGVFAFVFPFQQLRRATEALEHAGLVCSRRRDVIFREGETPSLSLFAAMREGDLPFSYRQKLPVIERELTVRRLDGSFDPEYGAVRLSFGFPPGHEQRDDSNGL